MFERQKVIATPHPHPPEGLLTALLLWASGKHSHMLSCCLKEEAAKTKRRKITEKKTDTQMQRAPTPLYVQEAQQQCCVPESAS